jgi:hypothetical protein
MSKEGMEKSRRETLRLNVQSILSAVRTAGALLIGNAALIAVNNVNDWEKSLKVVVLGAILITICSYEQVKVPVEPVKANSGTGEK